MRRYITILVLVLLSLGLGVTNLFPQEYSDNQKQAVFTDANTTPPEFHKMMSELKQKRIDKLQQLGKRIRPQGSLGQNDYDVKYYKLDLNLNDTTEILSGSVYIYALALIDGFNLVELNFFDNPQMYVDSIKSNGALLSFTWSDDIISVTLSQTCNQEPFDLTVYYHGHPLEGGLQSFDWGSHGSPPTPIMCTLSEPYFAQAWWPCKDLPKDKADSA
ncbi:MAG: hypothetical protein OEV55_02245, partial [candidate division Zixibacteria bacterium]|nr:hypothetical protein [candidate division Zixibacteria bacterium]